MIKKRNLDSSLIQWIMTQTGLGPGIGELFWVAPAASSSSQYRTHLEDDLGVSDTIYSTPTTAYAAMVAGRNDVMLVMPGAYDLTASLAWSKANTHLLGLGGPNVGGDFSEPNVVIYTDSTDVASVVNITGQNAVFRDVNIQNYGNNAACLTALILNKYGCHFRNVAFMGNMTTNQNTTVAASSLDIATNGMYPVFEDCIIGQDVWGERSGALSGQLRFTGTGQPNGGLFRNCRFLSRSETATVAMVALPANGAVGRSWLWDNCFFANLDAQFTNLNQVFYMNDSAGQVLTLHNCIAQGFDEWQDADNSRLVSDMPAVDTGGGLVRAPTATAYAGTDR